MEFKLGSRPAADMFRNVSTDRRHFTRASIDRGRRKKEAAVIVSAGAVHPVNAQVTCIECKA